MSSTEEALQAVFARWARRERAPGIAWGLVREGELVAGGGVGTLEVGEPAEPGADSVFRIASMTKSFTGAALMSLVVDGRVGLDQPVAVYVPELEGWRGPTDDGPPLTVRHLVSMESGLPTDDPWADRHVDLPADTLDELIGAGAAWAWPPGVRFEYSNLGWGLVGRVIERVSGIRAQDLVTSAVLEPLGLSSTTWVRPPSPAAVAEPYRVQDGTWLREAEPLGDGTIAPMGGLWSSVRDVACWVAFFTDAFPPRDGIDDGPLPRWARREMQQLRRLDQVARSRPSPGGPSRLVANGYGIGLSVRVDERLGVSVGHSGGLPGYGSHMRWLPDRGVGVVGLSNVTYGNMHAACTEALEVLADRDELGPETASEPSPSLAAAASRAASLLSSWSDADAEALFADNVGLDEPFDRRGAQAVALVDRSGPLGVDALSAESPLRGSFTAAAGRVSVELGLSHAGEVQWLDVEDRAKPSDAPIVVDEATFRAVAGTGFVLVRPVGDLADAFARWQGDVLDRVGGPTAAVPAGHMTMKAFGSPRTPLGPADEEAVVELTRAWAASHGPMELVAERLEVFEGERLPVVRLARTTSLDAALRDLWSRCDAEGLPPAPADDIGVERWIPHLTLADPGDVDRAHWSQLEAWVQTVDVGCVGCQALEAEVVAYGGTDERRLATCRFLVPPTDSERASAAPTR